MSWHLFLPAFLIGALLGLLFSFLLSRDDEPSPPPPTPQRPRQTPPSPASRVTSPAASPTVRRPAQRSPSPPSAPAPVVRRPVREAPSTFHPSARAYDPQDPRDFPHCPICSAGNDLGEQMIFKVGPRRYRCVEGHEF